MYFEINHIKLKVSSDEVNFGRFLLVEISQIGKEVYYHFPHTLFVYLLVFCQIPCLNGGRCIGQNECWCPSNSTGKFCHLPNLTPSKPSPGRQINSSRVQNGSSQTVYTLPLSNQQGKNKTQSWLRCTCSFHILIHVSTFQKRIKEEGIQHLLTSCSSYF